MSPQLFFSIVVRLTQSQLQSWILSYERRNANHSKGRVITVPLRHPWPLRIIINEQFYQEKKLKGPECGVVMSVMTGVRWSKNKGLLTATPPGSQSTLLACNFKTGISASKKNKCYRYHSLYKCTQPASESNWWVCGGSPQRRKTVKTAAWVWAGERNGADQNAAWPSAGSLMGSQAPCWTWGNMVQCDRKACSKCWRKASGHWHSCTWAVN